MASQSRVVLLTGAAGGIGRVMTQALLADGHRVAAVDRDAASLDRLTTLCNSNEQPAADPADLSSEAGCRQAVEAARERFGAIEAVVNNAGIGQSAIRPDAEVRHPGIEELTPEIWDRFFNIFVRAPAIIIRAALPLMNERGFGRIVNNTTSYLTMLRVLPYGAAKAALESMSAVWAKELEGKPDHRQRAGAGRPDRHAADRATSRAGRATRCCGRRSWARRSAGYFRRGRVASTASASPPRAGTPRCRRRKRPSAPAAPSAGPSSAPTRCG